MPVTVFPAPGADPTTVQWNLYSNATTANSSASTVTIIGTTDYRWVGLTPIVNSGIGNFANNTIITSIANSSAFTVNLIPTVALSSANISIVMGNTQVVSDNSRTIGKLRSAITVRTPTANSSYYNTIGLSNFNNSYWTYFNNSNRVAVGTTNPRNNISASSIAPQIVSGSNTVIGVFKTAITPPPIVGDYVLITDTITGYQALASISAISSSFASPITVPQSQQLVSSSGVGTFTVPANVYSISVVSVGSGGTGYQGPNATNAPGGGGGGGGTGYKNNIAVTPGSSIRYSVAATSTDTVVSSSVNGNDTFIYTNSYTGTVLTATANIVLPNVIGLVVGMPIYFTNVITGGNILANTDYWITSIIGNTIQMSTTNYGSAASFGAAGSGITTYWYATVVGKGGRGGGNPTGGIGGSYLGDGGGNGGNGGNGSGSTFGGGGGGAGGYNGAGGAGANAFGSNAANAVTGSGGGGGGGAPNSGTAGGASSGGGVGILGIGSDGTGGASGPAVGTSSTITQGGGGSGGSGGLNKPNGQNNGQDGGIYGGGGGGAAQGITATQVAGSGAAGALRIIWPSIKNSDGSTLRAFGSTAGTTVAATDQTGTINDTYGILAYGITVASSAVTNLSISNTWTIQLWDPELFAQSNVLTNTAPTTARERYYYALLAKGKYGVQIPYEPIIGALSNNVLTSNLQKQIEQVRLVQLTSSAYRGVNFGNVNVIQKTKIPSTATEVFFSPNFGNSNVTILQSSVSTIVAPTTPRERYYYALLTPGKYGNYIPFKSVHGALPNNVNSDRLSNIDTQYWTYFNNANSIAVGTQSTKLLNYTTISSTSTSGSNTLITVNNPSSGINYITSGQTYYGKFNGTSQYLSAAQAAGVITTGPFTIEAWINPTSLSNTPYIVEDTYWNIGNNGGWYLGILPAGNLTLGYSTATFNAYSSISSTNTLSINLWTHVAVVRDINNLVSFYINGQLANTPAVLAQSLNLNSGGTQTNWNTRIGCHIADSNFFNGFNGNISNIRIVPGKAVYTGSFTPLGPLSTKQITRQNVTALGSTETSLLTLQNATIIDNSVNTFSITNTGAVTTTQSTALGIVPVINDCMLITDIVTNYLALAQISAVTFTTSSYTVTVSTASLSNLNSNNTWAYQLWDPEVIQQANVLTNISPTTPRERYYYALLAKGKYGYQIPFQTVAVGMPNNILVNKAQDNYVARGSASNNTLAAIGNANAIILQSSVSTIVAPTNARERYYYALLAKGRYGVQVPYEPVLADLSNNILLNNINSTILQSSVSTIVAPTNARERYYYALLAKGRYGVRYPYDLTSDISLNNLKINSLQKQIEVIKGGASSNNIILGKAQDSYVARGTASPNIVLSSNINKLKVPNTEVFYSPVISNLQKQIEVIKNPAPTDAIIFDPNNLQKQIEVIKSISNNILIGKAQDNYVARGTASPNIILTNSLQKQVEIVKTPTPRESAVYYIANVNKFTTAALGKGVVDPAFKPIAPIQFWN